MKVITIVACHAKAGGKRIDNPAPQALCDRVAPSMA
jgi:hypothetical protein